VPATTTRLSSPAVTTEVVSGAGISMLPVTEADAEGYLNRSPVSSRDEKDPIAVAGNEAREDQIAMEGNEVREIAADCKLGAADCEKSGSTRPPAEAILETWVSHRSSPSWSRYSTRLQRHCSTRRQLLPNYGIGPRPISV
jgi:hypothetical protein